VQSYPVFVVFCLAHEMRLPHPRLRTKLPPPPTVISSMTSSALSGTLVAFAFEVLFCFHLLETFFLPSRLVLESLSETVVVPPPIYSVAQVCDDHDYFFKLPTLRGSRMPTQRTVSTATTK